MQLTDFVAHHLACIEDAAGLCVDSVATVPSSDARTAQRRTGTRGVGDHPLDAIAAGIPLLARFDRVTLVRTGSILGHLAPHAEGFRVVDDIVGRRVLVVDDSWVTGARACSAAAVLEDAGAAVLAILVAGRIIDTAAAPGVAHWWHWAVDHAADPRLGSHQRCCLARCRWQGCAR